MIGSLLAGTKNPLLEIFQGRSFKVYRGMGSLAMEAGSKDRYFKKTPKAGSRRRGRQSALQRRFKRNSVSARGRHTRWHGLLRHGDNRRIENKAKFIKITNASLIESHPHDIAITKESPNYSTKA